MGRPRKQGKPFHRISLMRYDKEPKTAENMGRNEDNPRSSGPRELPGPSRVPQLLAIQGLKESFSLKP